MLTPDQLAAELRPVFRGRLLADALSRALYATDASPFEVTPLLVAEPVDEDDAAALLAYCHEHAVPVTPRGAGTGLAGEALGPGVILDLSVHFRRVVEVGPDWVRAEAGVTLAELNAELALRGRRFAPDPATAASCTVGGMVATNASGGTAYRHGYTRDHVLGLRTLAADGTRTDVVRLSPSASEDRRAERGVVAGAETSLRSAILARARAQTEAVAELLSANRELIEATRPRTPFNRCGYVLHDVLTPHGPDLARLLVGTEGTLAVVTEATLRTVPVPGGVGLFACGFPSLPAALHAGLTLRGVEGVAGCDLLDQRLVARSRADGVGVPADVAAALVVTIEADTERDAVAQSRAALDRLTAAGPLMVLAEPACDPAGRRPIVAFRQRAVSGLYALGPGRRPEAFVEDVGVPADALPLYVAAVQVLLRDADLPASFLVHVLTGQVHTRPLVDLADAADRAKLWPLAEKVHALALDLGGTVSTQHGTGLARTPWVEKQYGPLLPVFRELKRIFDPKGVLNPGKILGPDPSRPAWPLKAGSGQRAAGSEDGSPEPAGSVALLPAARCPLPAIAEASKCNGCGDCRPRGTDTRMCPVFRATGAEAATPRAKANLVLAGIDDPTAVRAVAGLCVNCKMCRTECRAGVDVPRLMLEAKAKLYADHGFGRHQWFQARIDALAATAGNFAFTSNLLLGTRWGRWAVEKLTGLSRRRPLPRFTARTFLRHAHRQGLTKCGTRNAECGIEDGFSFRIPHSAFRNRRVAYFVDTFANRNDPLVGRAAVAVLRQHGFEVHVPRRQRACGMAPLAAGDADTARDYARYNLRTLGDLVRDGYVVVCSEPTAAVALMQEYPALLPDAADAKLVASRTVELTALLGDLLDAGELAPPTGELEVGVGHHVPCHLKALGRPAAAPRLLAAIPGLTVHTIDVGCSGMAGAWGLAADNVDVSLAAGRAMLAELDRPRAVFGSTECAACRLQMQHGTGKRVLHPVQYLAFAYGLLPELERRLATRPRGLLTD